MKLRYLFLCSGIAVLLMLASNAQPATTSHTSAPDYVSLAQQDAASAGISPDLFVRQINQESGFNPNALSPAGAEGIAQFMPDTAAGLGIDPWNPVQALQGAAQLMRRYFDRYGSYALALASYNAGAGSVHGAIHRCGDSWLSCLPLETQQYVYNVCGSSC